MYESLTRERRKSVQRATIAVLMAQQIFHFGPKGRAVAADLLEISLALGL